MRCSSRESLARAFLLAISLWIAACHEAEKHTIVEGTSEVLFDSTLWTVVTERKGRPVHLASLSLCNSEYRADLMNGARELPGLAMAPPAVVEFMVPEGANFLLKGAFGLQARGKREFQELGNATMDAKVELLHNGITEELFRAKFDFVNGLPVQDAWAPFERDGKPLAVPSGGKIRLSTEQTSGDDQYLGVGAGGVAFLEVTEVETATASASAPNVIFVVMDTLRADHTSTFGHGLPTTPHLDVLAAKGVRYTRARATSSWTWPSTASLLTGVAPTVHGVVRPGDSWLRDDWVTLAEYMQRAGMATAGFSGNRLVSADFNFDQGFQKFVGPNRNAFIDGAELMPGALAWLAENKDQRFFLYLQLVDPHFPYDPLPESVEVIPGEEPDDFGQFIFREEAAELFLEGRQIVDPLQRPYLTSLLPKEHINWLHRGYDQAVHTGDAWLGVLMEQLERDGLLENTVVVFTSDHGEEVYEHGGVNHGQSLYPELVHVPLVLYGPGIPEGVSSDEVVSNSKLFGFLSSIAEGGYGSAGADPLKATDPYVYYSTERGKWLGTGSESVMGIEDQQWVLHFSPLADEVRLYNYATDPLQYNEVSADNPEAVERLMAALIAHAKESQKARLGDGGLNAGPGAIEALKAIGYL